MRGTMRIGQRIMAVLVLVCMTGACLLGGRLEMTGASEELTGLSLFDRKETIYFWYSEEDMADFINSAAVAFGNEHSVRVLPRLVSESEYLEAINEATLHSDHVPDVYLISHDSLEKAYLAGLAAEVTQTEVCSEAYFPQAALSAVTYHGKLVAYPFYYDTTALVYNKTYLNEWLRQQAETVRQDEEGDGNGQEDIADTGTDLGTDMEGGGQEVQDPEAAAREEARIAALLETGIPQTVDDILYIGDTFDLPDGVEGIMKWDVSNIFYNHWIVGRYLNVGGECGDDASNVNIYNPETLACLEIYKALNQFFSMESDTISYDSVLQDLLDGKIVFTIATVDVVKLLDQAGEEGSLAYEFGVATMPRMSDTLDSRSMSVTGAVAVNGYSEHKELANEFAAFLTGEYSQGLYAWTGRAAANLAANQDHEVLKTFQREYAKSIPLPKMIETSNYWIQLEVLFSKVWNGGDVDELLLELSNQIDSQLGG